MILIDVRTAEEFAVQHADGAINLSLQDLSQGAQPDVAKDEKIVVYCRSGGRSEQAKHILQQAGFTDVTNAGGLTDVLFST